MGGQLDFFAFYISDSFATGHTRGVTSSTFGNSPLSLCDGDYVIEEVEVWLVKRKVEDDLFVDLQRSSVLDNNSAANFLEMAGHTMYSRDMERVDDTEK